MPIPNFFIVGSVKCGTTWLFDNLCRHPQVFGCAPKEPHYFSGARHRIGKAYMRHVHDKEDYHRLFRDADGARRIGEASTSYLWSEVAIPRICREIPKAKIIAILRDPVERAYSHYLMDVREGVQTLSFREALTEDQRIEHRAWHTANLYEDLGFYSQQVERLQACRAEDEYLLLSFDNLRANPSAILRRVVEFLGIKDCPSVYEASKSKTNEYAVPRSTTARFILGNERFRLLCHQLFPRKLRSFVKRKALVAKGKKPEMCPEAKSYLRERFADDVARLASLVDFDPVKLWGER